MGGRGGMLGGLDGGRRDGGGGRERFGNRAGGAFGGGGLLGGAGGLPDRFQRRGQFRQTANPNMQALGSIARRREL